MHRAAIVNHSEMMAISLDTLSRGEQIVICTELIRRLTCRLQHCGVTILEDEGDGVPGLP